MIDSKALLNFYLTMALLTLKVGGNGSRAITLCLLSGNRPRYPDATLELVAQQQQDGA